MIVAELSGNHNRSLDKALRLVEAAAKAGADAIKLQTYSPDMITMDHDGPGFKISSGPWAGRSLYDLYSEAALPRDWHVTIFDAARELGLLCFSSPFDVGAVDFLETLNCPIYKIASFEITDVNLIGRAASTGKPLIISTGMASDADIELALDVCDEHNASVALLHCVSAYPTPIGKSNLRRITHLATQFGRPVGLSDHTTSATAAIAAVALGAQIIEKHLTLDRSDGGPDAEFSLEPHEFSEMAKAVKDAFAAMKDDDERDVEVYRHLRRSLYAVDDIKKGQALTNDNIRSIRPGFGLHPKHLNEMLLRSAAVDIKRGTPLRHDMAV